MSIREVSADQMQSMRSALHALSQPVTAANCLLQIAQMQMDHKTMDREMQEAFIAISVEVQRIVNGFCEVRDAFLDIESSR